MGIIEFTCKHCGWTRKTTPNTGFTCPGCGTRYSIGPDGRIRKEFRPKK